MNHEISFCSFMTLISACPLIHESSFNCLQIKILQIHIPFPLGALQSQVWMT